MQKNKKRFIGFHIRELHRLVLERVEFELGLERKGEKRGRAFWEVSDVNLHSETPSQDKSLTR